MSSQSSALPVKRCGEIITVKTKKHFCPNCCGQNVYKSTRWSRFLTLFVIGIMTFWFMAGLPFLIAAPLMLLTPTRYKCTDCNARYSEFEYQKRQMSYLRKIGQLI